MCWIAYRDKKAAADMKSRVKVSGIMQNRQVICAWLQEKYFKVCMARAAVNELHVKNPQLAMCMQQLKDRSFIQDRA